MNLKNPTISYSPVHWQTIFHGVKKTKNYMNPKKSFDHGISHLEGMSDSDQKVTPIRISTNIRGIFGLTTQRTLLS